MIDVRHLVFEYPGVCALDDVSLTIRRGDVTALVGPNGAGKTTLMRCLAALDQPISGSITIDGLDVLAHPRDCHRKVGYVSDFFGLFQELTVGQSLHYLARAHGLPESRVTRAVGLAAKRLQIDDRLAQKTKTLSRGLSQRLAIAQAIVHQPQVLLLDEPASGLDPEARKHLSDLFLTLRAEGITLVVSSHILAELEEYATTMVIVRGGKIVDHQALGLRDEATVMIGLTLSEPVERLAERLGTVPGISQVTGTDLAVSFRFAAAADAQRALLQTLIGDQTLPVCGFVAERTNLQDAYLHSMGTTVGGDQP
ncbi:MAG: ABC transporter ATP-binding protein [Candidatus Sericytochromatia bacterium]|nr:ABC transporter ATP-binding protein [Candidatus Sericytochromatia bacterium]